MNASTTTAQHGVAGINATNTESANSVPSNAPGSYVDYEDDESCLPLGADRIWHRLKYNSVMAIQSEQSRRLKRKQQYGTIQH